MFTLAVSKETLYLLNISRPHSALPSGSQQYWLVTLQLLPHSWESASSLLPTPSFLLDPSVFPTPNVFVVNETLTVSFGHASSLWFWFYFYDFEYPQFIIKLLYLTPAKRDILIVFLLCDKLPQMWQLKITWMYYPTVPVGLILGNPCWNLCLGSHGMNWRWQLVLQPHPGSVFKMINVSIIYFMKATT